MAISIDLGSGAGSTNGDTLFEAFTKVNTMFSTTSKESTGDLNINGISIGSRNQPGCTRVGFGALQFNTSIGTDNTAVGWGTLAGNTTGICNTAIGGLALQSTNGFANTAVGYASQQSTTSGAFNTSVGHFSLKENEGGVRNTAIGYVALEENLSGSGNTAVGEFALRYNQGNSCTALGQDAFLSNTTYTNSTCLGHNAQVSASNQVRIGDSNVTAVISQVGSWSDIRDKADVRDTVLGLDFINSLRAVDYKWDYREDYRTEKPNELALDASEEEKVAHKILMDAWLESCKLSNLVHDGTHKRTRYHHGLIAQEVKSIIETTGVDFGGFQDHTINGGEDAMTISYMELITPMIKAIQELTARINVLEGN